MSFSYSAICINARNIYMIVDVVVVVDLFTHNFHEVVWIDIYIEHILCSLPVSVDYFKLVIVMEFHYI